MTETHAKKYYYEIHFDSSEYAIVYSSMSSVLDFKNELEFDSKKFNGWCTVHQVIQETDVFTGKGNNTRELLIRFDHIACIMESNLNE